MKLPVKPEKLNLAQLNWRDPKVSGTALAVLVVAFLLWPKTEKTADPTAAATKPGAVAAGEARKSTQAHTPTALTVVPGGPERPLLCPAEECAESPYPRVILLTSADDAPLLRGRSFTLTRAALPFCVRIGDLVQFARYDRTKGAAFWVAEGRLFAARSVNDQLQLQFQYETVSPTESQLLAPLCHFPCRAITNTYALSASNPIEVALTDARVPDMPRPHRAGAFLLRVPPEDLARSLQALKLPAESTRPLVLTLPTETYEWKGALDWLVEHSKAAHRQVYWKLEADYVKLATPPSVAGITEVNLYWLAELQRQRAVLFSPQSNLDDIPWAGDKLPSPDESIFPTAVPWDTRELAMIGTWQELWPKLKTLVRNRDRNSKIVVMSRGIADSRSYYLARILAADRRPNIYWYRSSAARWSEKLAFDPPPAGFEAQE